MPISPLDNTKKEGNIMIQAGLHVIAKGKNPANRSIHMELNLWILDFWIGKYS